MWPTSTLLLALGTLFQVWMAGAAFSPPDPNTCVDPSGMVSCQNAVSNFQQVCETQYCPLFQQFTCPAFCQSTTYQNALACIYNHCWNQLYSCYAQTLALDGLYFTANSLPTADPPPQMIAQYSAGCSCAIYQGWEVARYYANFDCINEENGSGLGDECFACSFSGLASTMPQVCPGVNADQVDSWFQAADEAASSLALPVYSSALAQAACTAQSIGYSTFVNDFTFYQAAAIPTGTSLPTDSGTLTAPPFSPTIWALAAGGSTITLSPVSTGAAAASPNSNSGSSGGGGSGGVRSSAVKSARLQLFWIGGGVLVGVSVLLHTHI